MRNRGAWFTAITGIAFLVIVMTWLTLDRRIPREAFRPYSVHNMGPQGLSLANRYLANAGGVGPVSTLTRPPELATMEPDGVLFRLGPVSDGSSEKFITSPDEEWVRKGGRLVLGIDAPYANLSIKIPAKSEPARIAFPLWAPPFRVDPPVWRVLEGAGLDSTHAILAKADGPVLSRAVLGEGEIFLLSVPRDPAEQAVAAGRTPAHAPAAGRNGPARDLR